jgi:hypothetical protein
VLFRSRKFNGPASEQTDTPTEIRELALAHVSGDNIAAAYQRSGLLEKAAHANGRTHRKEPPRGSEYFARHEGRPAVRACGVASGKFCKSR